MIHQAVLDACDTIDGLKDGLIDDPTRCHFDPEVLECKEGDAPSCLTARQVQTARAILSPATTGSGHEIFPRLEPGTELRWARLAGGPVPADLFLDYFKYVVFKDPPLGLENLRPRTRCGFIERDRQEYNCVGPRTHTICPSRWQAASLPWLGRSTGGAGRYR